MSVRKTKVQFSVPSWGRKTMRRSYHTAPLHNCISYTHIPTAPPATPRRGLAGWRPSQPVGVWRDKGRRHAPEIMEVSHNLARDLSQQLLCYCCWAAAALRALQGHELHDVSGGHPAIGRQGSVVAVQHLKLFKVQGNSTKVRGLVLSCRIDSC